MFTPLFLLALIALIFAVAAFVWPNLPLLNVSVILIAIALMIGGRGS